MKIFWNDENVERYADFSKRVEVLFARKNDPPAGFAAVKWQGLLLMDAEWYDASGCSYQAIEWQCIS